MPARRLAALLSVLALLSPVAAFAADDTSPRDAAPVHEARWHAVEPDARSTAHALLRPEGRTRWRLADLAVGDAWTTTIAPADGAGYEVARRGAGRDSGLAAFRVVRSNVDADVAVADDARDWLLPHLDPRLASATRGRTLTLIDDGVPLTIEVRRVGMGWIELPSGPREVILQRATTFETLGDGSRVARKLGHRWVDPRAGVVAEVWGPVGPDGSGRTTVDEANVVDEVLLGGMPLRLYVDELDAPLHARLGYGADYGDPTAISELTDPSYPDINSLLAAPSWNFQVTPVPTASAKIASTTVEINAMETCNADECGFTIAGATLGRQDRDFDTAEPRIILSVEEREDRANDTTIWLRAGVRDEGIDGGLTDGEARFCYVGNPTPLWQFQHQDAPGEPFYMTVGDLWGSESPFDCDNVIFNTVCDTNCGLFCPIWAYACGNETGTQDIVVLDEGVVTLPSGHTFNALVVRNRISYCTALGSSCGFNTQTVRLTLHLWVVPNIGTVVRLGTQTNEQNDNHTMLEDTDIKFGLYPPVAIGADTSDDTSITISWDPGLEPYASGDAQNPDPTEIDMFRVYWDTDSGMADGSYAFDSVNNPGQVVFGPGGTSATISGLTPGTDYYITVTSVDDYANPSSGILRTYESVLFPMSVPGSPPIPIELLASTTESSCMLTEEVMNLTARRVNPNDVEFSWSAVGEACATTYEVLRATDPSAAGNFTPLAPDSGGATTLTLPVGPGYFLVRSLGGGSAGPLGHFGQ